jgi:hypothetical protein
MAQNHIPLSEILDVRAGMEHTDQSGVAFALREPVDPSLVTSGFWPSQLCELSFSDKSMNRHLQRVVACTYRGTDLLQ